MRKLATLLLLVLLHFTLVEAQTLELNWKFKTQDRVLAPPTLANGVVYFGSEDGNFYAVDQENGTEKWHFTTRGRIQGQATLHDNLVLFESDNTLYALNSADGKEVWRFDPGWALWGYKIDPYDDKRSKPVVHEDIVYMGSSLGFVMAIDVKTGEKKAVIPTEYGQPVRSTPLISGNRLFFGDWAGKVYAYSLEQNKSLWTQRTYDKKLYDSFGGVVSELHLYQGKLYFGARNHDLQVLDAISGQQVWQYADSTGGWIIGDPVIDNGTLFIGGSDNLKMFAFEPETGHLKWTFQAGLNIYTKPVVTDQYVIFTAGDSYAPKKPGKLFVINRENGAAVAEYEVPQGTFSSPAMHGNHIFFGCYDGYLYTVKLKK